MLGHGEWWEEIAVGRKSMMMIVEVRTCILIMSRYTNAICPYLNSEEACSRLPIVIIDLLKHL